MNKITAKYFQTPYHYQEFYWTIDNLSIVEHLQHYIEEDLCPQLQNNDMSGLLPAWSGHLSSVIDNAFIWELIDSPEDLNIPILVCEDDCDFNCLVILVHVRKTHQYVYWDKIGLLNQKHRNFHEEALSGILCLDSYTDEDWQKYGDNIALENIDSQKWKEWISQNWNEEYMRRLRNYLKPYMQNNENIIWIKETHWQFLNQDYQNVVELYRNFYRRSL